ncbi:MAG: hypothetical protein ACREL5_04575 [Gemmatimonadales bacterium]
MVTQQDYDDVVAAMVKGRDPALAARIRESAPKPPLFTAAFRALMDNHDRFWVLRSTMGERSEIWALLSARGVLLRTMKLPIGLSLVAARDDVIYLRAEQANGFQNVLRCPVSQASR